MVGVAARAAATSGLAERYERLRSAALSGVLPLEARSGLALFLRRGMWGWAQLAVDPSTPSRPSCSSSLQPIVHDERHTIIQLLAAMAMSSTKWRTHDEHVH